MLCWNKTRLTPWFHPLSPPRSFILHWERFRRGAPDFVDLLRICLCRHFSLIALLLPWVSETRSWESAQVVLFWKIVQILDHSLTSCVAQSVSHGAPGMRRGHAGWNLVVMLGHTWDCLAHPTTSASFWLRLLSLTRQVPPEMTLEQLQRHMKGPLTGLQYLTWWKWKRAVNAAVNICKGLCVWTRRTSVAQGSWLNFTRKTIIIKKKRWRRRAADKRPTQFVWTKQTNLFFTLTYSKYHTVGCNDDMPRFTHVSVCAGYVIIISHRLHLSHNLNHKIDKRPNWKKTTKKQKLLVWQHCC